MAMTGRSSGASWGGWFVRRHFRHAGWSDPGEAEAVASLHDELDGARVLDVGIGTGRTAEFLAPPSSSYIGIEPSPEMIRTARARHPELDLRIGDARELTGIPDSSCDLVVFSFNGIDAVPPPDRHRVLEEARRVLVPGGHLLVSMLNLDESEPPARPTVASIARPWELQGWRRAVVPVKNVVELAASHVNYRRTVRLSESGDGWAWRPMREHEFRFVVQFTRFDVAVQSLREAGFDVLRGWSADGDPVDVGAARQDVPYTHFVARRL